MMEPLIVGLDKIRKREEVEVSMKASSFSSPPPTELPMHQYPMKIGNFCIGKIVVFAPHLVVVGHSMRV